MDSNTHEVISAQGLRLAQARQKAGFRSARAAALAFDWAESSYRAHETGFRTIGVDDAERYAAAYRSCGVNVSAQDILFGASDDTDANEMPRVHFIAEWIAAKGVKQIDVANALGINKGTVSKWCAGELPSEDNVRALAGYLEVEPIRIFSEPKVSDRQSQTDCDNSNLATRLKARRIELGMTQEDVAAKVRAIRGVPFTQQTYAYLEAGKSRNSIELPAICEALDVSLRWIRDGVEFSPSEAIIGELEAFAHAHLEIRAWSLMQGRTTKELRRIIATIEAAFPRDNEGGDQ